MKVSELISMLNAFDGDLVVAVFDNQECSRSLRGMHIKRDTQPEFFEGEDGVSRYYDYYSDCGDWTKPTDILALLIY